MSPPSHPCWHSHPATSKGDGMCPVPACASLPSTPVCLSGDCFCAILNNSIFIGPTKTYHPRSAHTPLVCAPPTPAGGQLTLSAFPIPSPLASLCFPPKETPGPCPCDAQPATAEGHGAGSDSRGHHWGGQMWGSPAGHPDRVSNQRKSLAVSSSGLVAPSSRGGIFVLYFSHVLFPEPGSPVYHSETLIKNEPLAVVFFRAVSVCPERGQGPHAPLLHNQHCPRPGPAVGSSSVPVEQLQLSRPLAVLRLDTAWCRNELSCSSRAREWLLKVRVQHRHSGRPLGTRTTSSMGSLALLR